MSRTEHVCMYVNYITIIDVPRTLSGNISQATTHGTTLNHHKLLLLMGKSVSIMDSHPRAYVDKSESARKDHYGVLHYVTLQIIQMRQNPDNQPQDRKRYTS